MKFLQILAVITRKTLLTIWRARPTGSVALSVKPAASEIKFGRARAVAMSQEIVGGAVRRPKADKAV